MLLPAVGVAVRAVVVELLRRGAADGAEVAVTVIPVLVGFAPGGDRDGQQGGRAGHDAVRGGRAGAGRIRRNGWLT